MQHQQQFLKTAKIERNYGALTSANLYTVICQIGRLFGAKKLRNADIWLFLLDILRQEILPTPT